ncbi:DUF2637 domain-containing protein [Catellatospora tritici]|uniref:DUF2637 domain-containing protein n=1 Tax=Catellatospora tritici TaxID=2851566 RepID=UPI001C2DADAF|nr:DUF2637 domain-containing protein [Catellatospora tritici]MBV1851896.1 DUF2637 domain-containing protein [Catellatospora tritici]
MSLISTVTAARTEAAEQRRLDADAEVERQARAAQLALEVEAAKRESARQDRVAAEQARAEQDAAKAARKAAGKTRQAAAWQVRVATARKVGEGALWIGPILAPMAVAWVGQVQFAMGVLGWPVWAALVFAAAFELTTAYVARLDFLARHDGDSGTVFRAATWLFALIAAAMNYAHAAGPGMAPTGAAVAYGLMSLTGIALWELLSLYRHRKHLRDTGLRPAPLPRFGLARWTNFPAITWMARRLAIRDGHATVEAAWQAATAYWTDRAAAKATGMNAKTIAANTPPAKPVKVRTTAANGDGISEPDPRPVSAPPLPGGRANAAKDVAKVAAAHPDWKPAQIAAKLRLSERTVRRYMPGAAVEVAA